MSDQQDTSKYQIFRHKDAPGLMEAKCMTVEPFTPVQRAGMDKALASGYLEGDEIRVTARNLEHVPTPEMQIEAIPEDAMPPREPGAPVAPVHHVTAVDPPVH